MAESENSEEKCTPKEDIQLSYTEQFAILAEKCEKSRAQQNFKKRQLDGHLSGQKSEREALQVKLVALQMRHETLDTVYQKKRAHREVVLTRVRQLSAIGRAINKHAARRREDLRAYASCGAELRAQHDALASTAAAIVSAEERATTERNAQIQHLETVVSNEEKTVKLLTPLRSCAEKFKHLLTGVMKDKVTKNLKSLEKARQDIEKDLSDIQKYGVEGEELDSYLKKVEEELGCTNEENEKEVTELASKKQRYEKTISELDLEIKSIQTAVVNQENFTEGFRQDNIVLEESISTLNDKKVYAVEKLKNINEETTAKTEQNRTLELKNNDLLITIKSVEEAIVTGNAEIALLEENFQSLKHEITKIETEILEEESTFSKESDRILRELNERKAQMTHGDKAKEGLLEELHTLKETLQQTLKNRELNEKEYEIKNELLNERAQTKKKQIEIDNIIIQQLKDDVQANALRNERLKSINEKLCGDYKVYTDEFVNVQQNIIIADEETTEHRKMLDNLLNELCDIKTKIDKLTNDMNDQELIRSQEKVEWSKTKSVLVTKIINFDTSIDENLALLKELEIKDNLLDNLRDECSKLREQRKNINNQELIALQQKLASDDNTLANLRQNLKEANSVRGKEEATNILMKKMLEAVQIKLLIVRRNAKDVTKQKEKEKITEPAEKKAIRPLDKTESNKNNDKEIFRKPSEYTRIKGASKEILPEKLTTKKTVQFNIPDAAEKGVFDYSSDSSDSGLPPFHPSWKDVSRKLGKRRKESHKGVKEPTGTSGTPKRKPNKPSPFQTAAALPLSPVRLGILSHPTPTKEVTSRYD